MWTEFLYLIVLFLVFTVCYFGQSIVALSYAEINFQETEYYKRASLDYSLDIIWNIASVLPQLLMHIRFFKLDESSKSSDLTSDHLTVRTSKEINDELYYTN